MTLTFVTFCGSTTNGIDDYRARKPGDPAHRPARQFGREYECSCGWRELQGRRERVSRFWWPLTTVWKDEVLPGGVPHFIVCPYAKRGVDDQSHAPVHTMFRDGYGTIPLMCICGSNPDLDDLKLLPAY